MYNYLKNLLEKHFQICRFGKDDIFYHLGCGDEKGIEIAVKEFKVEKAVGIDNNSEKIELAKKILKKKNSRKN